MFSAAGYELFVGVIDPVRVAQLIEKLESELAANGGMEPHGIRLALARFTLVRALAQGPELMGIATWLLSDGVRPVKRIIFDKLPEANWKVPPHQDLTIAVKQRVEAEGFGPWTIKDSIDHVQPPVEVMERIVALRVHLDGCPAANGALRVVPGSHREGRLSTERMAEIRRERGEAVCEAGAGDVLAMAPLAIHSSAPSEQPGHRRVIHLEYSAKELPAGMQWHETDFAYR